MAELMNNGRSGHATPRIDLTPMVDLGFLLITFFMMTTSMSKPKAMDVQMPFKPATQTTAFYESSAITLMPAADHRLFYYEGLFAGDATGISEAKDIDMLREVLQRKQASLLSRANEKERDLQVLIKAHETASVSDIIALFDEMSILRVKFFAMTDIYPEEAAAVARRLGR